MNSLIELQRWLYAGMADSMKAANDPVSLQVLLVSAVLFGALHALMPGHGKSVLVSYHLGRPGRLRDGLMTGTLLALTHIGSAVILVLAGVAVISRTVAGGGRAPAFETVSAALIVLIGVFLLGRTMASSHHGQQQDGRWLAIVTGLVPCPLTTFILAYALARGMLWIGLAAVAAMSIGVILTIAGFAVAAVYSRGRLMDILASSEHWRQHVGEILEIAGALAVIVIGLAMLLPRLSP
jgi:ABC-type nickel/cobalt efflux system permease component RcnA